MTRQVDGISVRHGAAGTEEALATLPADDGAHLSQHVLLHQGEHRRHLVRVDGRIERVGQPLAQQSVRVQTWEQLIDEVRMARLHAVLDDIARKGQQFFVGDAFGGRKWKIYHGMQIARIDPLDHSILSGSRLQRQKKKNK